MKQLPPLSWKELVEVVCEKVHETIGHSSDALKDAVVDAALVEDQQPQLLPAETPPPLSTEAFLFLLHDKVEATLRRVADAINRADSARELVYGEEIWNLFAELRWEAIQLGWQLRLDALADSLFASAPRPQSAWAQKYRRMIAADVAAPDDPEILSQSGRQE